MAVSRAFGLELLNAPVTIQNGRKRRVTIQFKPFISWMRAFSGKEPYEQRKHCQPQRREQRGSSACTGGRMSFVCKENRQNHLPGANSFQHHKSGNHERQNQEDAPQ